jgi:flagellin-like hook-associated protein FlgL
VSNLQAADDLNSYKNNISESIQTMQAANNGVQAISKLADAAKGIANAALLSNDPNERSQMAQNYNTMVSQMNDLAKDSGYRGTDLLTGGSQTVQTGNQSSVQIKGFDGTGGAQPAGGNWATNNDIEASIKQIDTSVGNIRSNTAAMESQSSTLSVYQNFNETMANTLKTGAENLTLADMNEEAAKTMMSNTRQQLATTSLGMASNSAGNVLKMF